ncbi:MAG TPA: TIGR03960 family B12-binding radical SAM protein [Bacillota bacterium]|nr:TIGR03960 family B12-binding radical SAM protein [Bacillota bacterium]
MIPAEISALLTKVQKPSRYAGGEVNIVAKPPAPGLLRVALAFPDLYEVGMSHLGLKILYKVINEQEYATAERVFAPWPDMGELMQGAGVELYGLETYTPLRRFDVVGFTLQYELSYTNILYMLDLSGIPLRSSQRDESDPLIIAGGPCAFNVEPMADYFDCVVLGEGEEVILDILQCLLSHQDDDRTARLKALAQIPGVYVPSFHNTSYHEDGTFAAIGGSGPLPIEKRLIKELDERHIPVDPVVPYIDVVHDRVMLEAFRGCTRGCRFCQAGMIYRPVRETPPEVLLRAAKQAIASTGYEEVALTSLSTMDYSAIRELLPALVENLACQGVNVSLPSLRVDSFSVAMAAEVVKMRKSGLTLAPEAGSQRLRDVINKQVSADDLLRALQGARQLGFKSAKLYFMIGLPTETYEDLAELVHLVEQAARILPVTVSTSSFVPKSHTPFQWEPQFSIYELEQRQSYLKSAFRRNRQVKYNYHEAGVSFFEAVFSKGDRRLGPVIEQAYRTGCKFDGWSEYFDYAKWQDAFISCGVDPAFYANRRIPLGSALAWDHLSAGLDKAFLEREWQLALAGKPTVDCSMDLCSACGVCPGLMVMPHTVRRREP